MANLIKLSRKKASKHPSVRWDAMNEFCAFAIPEVLTEIQKAAYLAYFYSSQVEMGGHHEYFSSNRSLNHHEVVAALRAVDATEQAAILTAALSAVNTATRQAPEQYTDRYLAGVELADLEQFDDAFRRCEKPVAAHLMSYLDKNESEFIDWKP